MQKESRHSGAPGRTWEVVKINLLYASEQGIETIDKIRDSAMAAAAAEFRSVPASVEEALSIMKGKFHEIIGRFQFYDFLLNL